MCAYLRLDRAVLDPSHMVTLVHGPPGTGKSRTLLACLTALFDHERKTLLGQLWVVVFCFVFLSSSSSFLCRIMSFYRLSGSLVKKLVSYRDASLTA